MPHVKGLQILNDYQENQKLVSKLPDWAASRWNRQVTQALSQSFQTLRNSVRLCQQRQILLAIQ